MPRPPLARERVLDAYESILIAEGERAATLDGVAATAGVSKGGLLYHFGSKEELAAGLLQRLDDLVTADVTAMSAAPEGPVAYYIRTSIMEGNALDRALVASTRLAQGGHPAAARRLREVRERWADALRPAVRDEAALQLVMLLSDGLYFNNAIEGAATPGVSRDVFVPSGRALDELIALVERAVLAR
ncbi:MULTISPECIES: TetR/AcrR family transcriptional regulator [Microbacterium]|uniref:TetR/AcrR family transcriptional regulator n=1 Tax=Microbacterium TaxID=33882 RepID=UPI00217ECEC5|nr:MULTISPECIES: TetR/AcrR family transcriptional regulator [Microbacterium]UWF78404.1 TetR/AcrR family transcriptional regulator [Microbacterium neungamense]WCM56579.1 TetR/AcrR family transcriptional regulator [Microbacterium sp. EF45047]